jgi:hypothetical protein
MSILPKIEFSRFSEKFSGTFSSDNNNYFLRSEEEDDNEYNKSHTKFSGRYVEKNLQNFAVQIFLMP